MNEHQMLLRLLHLLPKLDRGQLKQVFETAEAYSSQEVNSTNSAPSVEEFYRREQAGC